MKLFCVGDFHCADKMHSRNSCWKALKILQSSLVKLKLFISEKSTAILLVSLKYLVAAISLKNNALLPLNTMKNKKHELSTSSIIKNHSLLQPKHSFLQKCSVFKMFLLFNLVFVVLRKSNFTIQIFFSQFLLCYNRDNSKETMQR